MLDLTRLKELPLAWVALCVVVASGIGCFVFLLLQKSGVDLSVISTSIEASNVWQTRYHPIGIVTLVALICAALLPIAFVLSILAPYLDPPQTPLAADQDDKKKIAEAGAGLGAELAKILGYLRGHTALNDNFAQSLNSAQQRLAARPEPEQVRVIVKLLLDENERMRRTTQDLTGKLEATQRTVIELTDSLSEAREEGLKDALTGVSNRRAFDAEITASCKEAEEKSSPISLIMCDIDHFKNINDRYGHAVGDEVLRMFGRILLDNARDGDVVARYGGEEFAIVLPNTPQTSAVQVAERLRRQFSEKQLNIRSTNQLLGQMTASFGVAMRRSGEEPSSLIERADVKLYEAKKAGRNRVATFEY